MQRKKLTINELYQKAYDYDRLKEKLDVKEKSLEMHVEMVHELRKERDGYLHGLLVLRKERRAFLNRLVNLVWKDALQSSEGPTDKHSNYLISKGIQEWKKDHCG